MNYFIHALKNKTIDTDGKSEGSVGALFWQSCPHLFTTADSRPGWFHTR